MLPNTLIDSYFVGLIKAIQLVDQEEFMKAVTTLQNAKDDGKFVWLFGNGGSAALASHFANDLTKACGIRAIAISDMTPTMLAYGNDDGWENMFSRLLRVFVRPGDVIVGISCSGKSENVIRAMPVELSSKCRRIALTGMGGYSPLVKSQPDVIIQAFHGDIKSQEDIHSIICHAIVDKLQTK